MFAETIERVKNTKFEFELIKIVDCFLHGLGNFDSNLVSFKIKSLKNRHFLNSKEICIKSIGSAKDIVNTPNKNPSAIKNAITKRIVLFVRQTHATHSYKIFLHQAINRQGVLCNTLMTMQQESEKKIWFRKHDFESKILRRVRF